jgi:hypothetical protein
MFSIFSICAMVTISGYAEKIVVGMDISAMLLPPLLIFDLTVDSHKNMPERWRAPAYGF